MVKKSLIFFVVTTTMFLSGCIQLDIFDYFENERIKPDDDNLEKNYDLKTTYLTVINYNDGSEIWNTQLKENVEYAAAKTAPDGSTYLAGYYRNKILNKRDAYLTKMDGNYSTLWEKKYDYDDGDEVYSLDVYEDGSCLLGGKSRISGSTQYSRMLLFRVNGNGRQSDNVAEKINSSYWQTRYVYACNNGNIIAVATEDGDSYLYQEDKLHVLQYNEEGRKQWHYELSEDHFHCLTDVEERIDGEYTFVMHNFYRSFDMKINDDGKDLLNNDQNCYGYPCSDIKKIGTHLPCHLTFRLHQIRAIILPA
jgi:outer membrane protein assembly factor BamB